MHVLLVEPEYYTTYPPLGLLKLSAYHKGKGDTTELVRGCKEVERKPDRVYVTSLFTWAWKPVWDAVRYYKRRFPTAEIWLGGLYASLLPEHATRSGADRVYVGLFKEAENLLPDYSLVPEWDGSIIFSSRGCNRNCFFCAVPRLEGKLNSVKHSIKHLIYPGHTRVIFWDNNILQSPAWKSIFDELEELDLKVDFNQGLDARLITEEVAERLADLKLDGGGIKVRLAYDLRPNGPFVRRAIELLNKAGIRGRSILVYALFNHLDSPQDFFERVRDILNWGAVCYPMRYEPINGPHALRKNTYISPNWTREEVEQVQRARRVMGANGAFPPRPRLVKKFNEALDFHEDFGIF
jgi:pyruvate-formate lyase-activating enzyme